MWYHFLMEEKLLKSLLGLSVPWCRNGPRPQLQPPGPVCPLKPLGLKTAWGVCPFSSKLSKKIVLWSSAEASTPSFGERGKFYCYYKPWKYVFYKASASIALGTAVVTTQPDFHSTSKRNS